MQNHLGIFNHGVMDPAPARYTIRIHGHLGITVLSAFPALMPRYHGADNWRPYRSLATSYLFSAAFEPAEALPAVS